MSKTIILQNKPAISGFAAVVGKKENEGPLKGLFDGVHNDTTCGEKSWEKAEVEMLQNAQNLAISKAGNKENAIEVAFSGDLLNQCIGSTFALKNSKIPAIGMYGACSTMALALANAAVFVDSKTIKSAIASASSHFCTAERQFRMPLEYGGQRVPSAQWTVTGAGACVVEQEGGGPKISAVSFGRIVDYHQTDVNNMGAAMAPAARDTIYNFLKDSGRQIADYCKIFTGDLGAVGGKILCELMNEKSIDISQIHEDCGTIIYDLNMQEVDSGGSGCGCSASVLCAKILPELSLGRLKKVLFVGTGALMSVTSQQQGETIPAIAHLVDIEA